VRLAIRALSGAAIAAGLAGAAFARHGIPALRLDQIVDSVHAAGPKAWLMFGAAQIGVAALGVLPASLMAAGAGAAFGFGPGFLLSSIGTMTGGWLAFALSRSALRPFIARLLERGPAMAFDRAIADDGWRFVCLLRVSPLMPFAATSYGLGLTGVSHRAFLKGTLASFPALAGYVAVGAFASIPGAGLLHMAFIGAGVAATLALGLRINTLLRRAMTRGNQSAIRPSERSIA
jgi:uncharacterized membrane protein YdjX (TVP38/TMEM64 family)